MGKCYNIWGYLSSIHIHLSSILLLFVWAYENEKDVKESYEMSCGRAQKQTVCESFKQHNFWSN